MKYEYFKHSINIEEKLLDAYGIILFVNGNEVVRLYDISTDINVIEDLVNSLNNTKPNPFKLGELLEQYMDTEMFI